MLEPATTCGRLATLPGPRTTERSLEAPTYKLLTETGEDLGRFRAGTPTWAPGDRIHRGHDTLEVVNVTAAEAGNEVAGYLVVRVSEARHTA